MKLEKIQTKAIETYNKNMIFLEEKYKVEFDNLKLFELALEMGEVHERYILEYKVDYFDIYDTKEEKWIYNTNSIKYSEKVTKNISFESKVNSFKTFYEIAYEDEIAEKSKKLSMLSSPTFGNAQIIDYVNRNLPKREEMKEIFIYFIFGVGLGLHIPLIYKRINAKLYLVIEPSLEIFRLSLFIIDYSALSKKTTLMLSVGENEEEFRKKFYNLNIQSLAYNHYIKFFMSSQNFDKYISTIQHSLVSQGHLLYAYNRQLLSLSRTYQYAKEGFNYINISKPQNLRVFKNKKIIILGAGPSLQKNLKFIKENQQKYIIVSIYSLMPYLEKHGIVPDIVTQYDESTELITKTFKSIDNISFFANTIYLFASHICRELMEYIPKESIYVFHALYEVKKDFGHLTSPSIGEITYALMQHFGSNDISLLGIDMSFDPETGKSHHDDYSYDFSNALEKENSSKSFTFRKNKIKVKGNFLKEVETLSAFKVSIEHINIFTKKYKKYSKTSIYNLSNGAYFEETIPLKPQDIDTSLLLNIDKKTLKDDIVTCFRAISSNEFTFEDLEYNEQKLKDTSRLKKKLDSFYIERKYVNGASLRSILNEMQEELLTSTYICSDLQKIILNYLSHNLHYIFYFTNLKNIDNMEKHTKQLFEILNIQINKIVSEYISFISIK